MKRSTPDYAIEIVDASRSLPAATALRLIYGVEGAATLTVAEEQTVLSKGELLLVNAGDAATIKPEKQTLLTVITLDYHPLCDLLGQTNVRFYVNSEQAAGEKYGELKERVQNLLFAYASPSVSDRIAERGYYYLLVESLSAKFLDGEAAADPAVDSNGLRMLHYIHANYRTTVSLNEIAEELSLSQSWASRIFTKATGQHFPSYVRGLRLSSAEQALVETGLSITRIAMDNGFSTPSAFTKAFRDDYGMTPSEYRALHKVTAAKPSVNERQKRQLYQVLARERALTLADRASQKTITFNTGKAAPWKPWTNRLLNVGPAYVLTSAKLQQQVLFLVETLSVEYVRIWNVFSSRLMIRRPDADDYNFSFIDEILDFCVDHKIKVFFDFASRKAVALASEEQDIFSYEDAEIPESAQAWTDLLRSFLVHIRKRYGERTVQTWIYEFTFYLNDQPYYRSEPYSSLAVWETSYETVKAVIPAASVAGPGLIANPDQATMKETIRTLLATDKWPDIFTSMHFPYLPDVSGTGSIYQQTYQKISNKDFIYEQALCIRTTLNELRFTGEFWITDWGNSLANRNFVQDSCFRAAFIVENALRVHELADAMGIFYASDIINAYADTKAELSGSAGLLSRNGICKPAYYAFDFLDELGAHLIAVNEMAVCTCEDPSDIRILCFNNKALGLKYYLSAENSYRPQELEALFVDTDTLN